MSNTPGATCVREASRVYSGGMENEPREHMLTPAETERFEELTRRLITDRTPGVWSAEEIDLAGELTVLTEKKHAGRHGE